MTPPADDRAPLTHDDAYEALLGREPVFHHELPGAGRAAFERITVPDFWEVGASGAVYDRETVIERLVERHAAPFHDPWEIDEFAVRQLGVITWLATYRLQQAERVTRRATVWTYVGGDWLAVYHQGTLAR